MPKPNPANPKPILKVKNDIVFRIFFADERNAEELMAFLKSVIRLPDDDYESMEILDPNLLIDYDGDKTAVIDVKLRTKSRKIIHIEIQLRVAPEMRKRIIFYISKLITEQIKSGDDYYKIEKVISIIITDEKLINDSPKYHHRFTFNDPDANIELTDLTEIHTIELSKLPEITDGTPLYDWAKFINAETEEELNMAAERNPQIKKAVIKLVELSADEKARDRAERLEKSRRDFNMFMRRERAEGEAAKAFAVARNAIDIGLDTETIIKLTNLTPAEIDALRG